MHEATHDCDRAGTVTDVRRVRIALAVGELMVLAMVGHPRDHGPFDRQRAEDREEVTDRGPGLERAVREQAMEADGHTEPGQPVANREVRPADGVAPEK